MKAQSSITAFQLTNKGFRMNPFDPFQVDLSGFEMVDIDPDKIGSKGMQVNLAVALFLIAMKDSPSAKTSTTGLRRFSEYHGWRKMRKINRIHILNDRGRVADEVRERAEERERRNAVVQDPWERARREQATAKSKGGQGAWRNYLDAVGGLYEFANGFSDVGRPLRGLKREPVKPNARMALTEDEMFAFWYAASLLEDPELSQIFLDLLRETACRVGAVESLNIEDFEWDTAFVTFRTKGKRTHRTCISLDLMTRIRDRAEQMGWDGSADPSYRSDDWNAVGFPALQTLRGARLGAKWTETFFNKIDRLAGSLSREKITAHWIRHTTITQVQRLTSQVAASRWAGHRIPKEVPASEQTAIYTKWTEVERRAIFNYMFEETPTFPSLPSDCLDDVATSLTQVS